MSIVRGRPRVEAVDTDAAVTPLELFFDLVFVFGLVQITTFMAADLSWRGLLHGVLIIGLLWWSWVCYAWVGNVARADEGLIRLTMFGAMATMFVLALSIPEAFDDVPGGLPGRWWSPCATSCFARCTSWCSGSSPPPTRAFARR